MNNEFKKINNNNITRYVLEDGGSGGATSGGTSAGSISGFAKPMGGIQRRAGDDLIHQENKKSYKVSHKPKNPVAKAHQTVGTGSGAHTDKTKTLPRKEKHKKPADMTMENFNAEYDDEAGMSYGSLHTINRAATGLLDTIKEGDDLPEWCQEKISLAEDYLITVWDYLQSEKEQGVAEGRFGKDAYDRDYDSSIAGMDGSDKRDFKRAELQHELGHETNNIAITINGKTWKVVPGRGTADSNEEWQYLNNMKKWAEKKSASSGKKWTVHLTGANVTEQLAESAYGDIKVWDYLQSEKEQGVAEEWSQKYKSSINCSHPKGFSQRAHCAGKKKHNESIEMESVCPDCGMCQTHGNLNEIAKGAKDSNGFTKCWPGKHAAGTKKGKNGGQVRNCVPNESTDSYMESLMSALAEKLDPNAEPEVWVQDFQKANPNKYHQFKNKTPQKKAQMAVAARRDARLKK